jgi:hypothetical protein
MDINIHVQFQSTREASDEDKARIKEDIGRLINKYEGLVVGDISIEVI